MTRDQWAAAAGIGAMFLVGTVPGCEPLVALLCGFVVTCAGLLSGQEEE